MIKEELRFKTNVAQRLMNIARDERILEGATRPSLPPEWRTLYELTKLDDGTRVAAEEAGPIWPGIESEENARFRR
jgi:hypothetical protein